jgi:hypothetical protein
MLSTAFNCERRAWHVKVDIDSEQNLSLWLSERGAPVHGSDSPPSLGQASHIEFSSVEVQFEVVDKGTAKRFTFFFTFAHDKHQVVGQRNFLNLKQLTGLGDLKVNVYMREDLMASALHHFYSANFSTILD